MAMPAETLYTIDEVADALQEAEVRQIRLQSAIGTLQRAMTSLEAGGNLSSSAQRVLTERPWMGTPPAARPALVPAAASMPEPSRVVPAAAVHPFAGRMGAPMPPHEPSPAGEPPQMAAPSTPQSVDVGALQRLSPEALDSLPFGVVTLDHRGTIVGYNDTESRLVGLPKDRVIGRHFFREVAPCTAVKEFEGRFQLVADGRSTLGVESFDFVFNFASGAQRVSILVSPARQRGRFHVSMIRR